MAECEGQEVMMVVRCLGIRETPSPDDTRTPPAAPTCGQRPRAPAKEPRLWSGAYEVPDAEACHVWQAWHPTGAYYTQCLYSFRGGAPTRPGAGPGSAGCPGRNYTRHCV